MKKIKKPNWIKVKLIHNQKKIKKLKEKFKKNRLNTVCEEASCPNIQECFSQKTATFMILGSICTRKCPFCDVSYGRPNVPDLKEPENLAKIIYNMKLKYVVITSVDRDDLHDGGAKHFSNSIKLIRKKNKNVKIEILVPDFRSCSKKAIMILKKNPPDVFNHNIETVPRLYKTVKPGAKYKMSLKLLKNFKKKNPNIPTKSGLMVGLGETNKEINQVMYDLKEHGVTMITIGQYLQPSKKHLPVQRYVSIKEFRNMEKLAKKIGFKNAFCGPLIRSSYLADKQSERIIKKIKTSY